MGCTKTHGRPLFVDSQHERDKKKVKLVPGAEQPSSALRVTHQTWTSHTRATSKIWIHLWPKSLCLTQTERGPPAPVVFPGSTGIAGGRGMFLLFCFSCFHCVLRPPTSLFLSVSCCWEANTQWSSPEASCPWGNRDSPFQENKKEIKGLKATRSLKGIFYWMLNRAEG